MKKSSLRKLFERERSIMTNYFTKKLKQKKFKTMHSKLVNLQDNQIEGVLNEYFKMCKMIYRIKRLINYVWLLDFDIS